MRKIASIISIPLAIIAVVTGPLANDIIPNKLETGLAFIAIITDLARNISLQIQAMSLASMITLIAQYLGVQIPGILTVTVALTSIVDGLERLIPAIRKKPKPFQKPLNLGSPKYRHPTLSIGANLPCRPCRNGKARWTIAGAILAIPPQVTPLQIIPSRMTPIGMIHPRIIHPELIHPDVFPICEHCIQDWQKTLDANNIQFYTQKIPHRNALP